MKLVILSAAGKGFGAGTPTPSSSKSKSKPNPQQGKIKKVSRQQVCGFKAMGGG